MCMYMYACVSPAFGDGAVVQEVEVAMPPAGEHLASFCRKGSVWRHRGIGRNDRGGATTHTSQKNH